MHKNSLAYTLFIFTISIILAGFTISNAIGEDKPGQEIRPPSATGNFYPASASQLRKSVNVLLNNIPERPTEGEIFAAMAPHAAYVYSGEVAAHTFKQLSKVDFDTIVIIGHDSYRNAVAFTCPVDYFQTPLGKVPVDKEMIEKMHAFNRGIKASRSIHSDDHSIEIQLPFLQILGKNCRIVPILFGNPTPKNCQILADAIVASAGDKKVFVLASTDMSHYPTYELANSTDNSTLEVLKTMNVERLFDHLDEQVYRRNIPDLQTAMCARGGVGTAILFSKSHGADHTQILHYANSGDAPIGSKQRVVGYSSVLFLKKAGGD